MAGINLDPWQQLVLETSLREREDHRWAASEVGLLVARQNGKGSLLVARELVGLFLLGEKLILHSAHEFKTAADGFRRLLQAIESCPDLDAQVAKKIKSHGQEGIELKNGGRIQFIARTVGSGRGFTADLVILDEAYNLTDAQMSALTPTTIAVDNSQTWYTSSAVNAEEHQNGLVLTRVRNRGLKGSDGLAYMEWSAEDGADPLDPEAWAAANPALGIRIRPEAMAKQQRASSPKAFAVEHLSIGDWPLEEGSDRAIPAEAWDKQADCDSASTGRVVFAVDLSPDRATAAISAAGKRADGGFHVEVIQVGAGSSWLTRRLLELKARWNPLAIIVDPGSPTGSLLPELKLAGIEPTLLTTRDVVQGCGALYDGIVDAHNVWHMDQDVLNAALAGAKKRDVTGGGWAWDRRTFMTDLTPLVSATNALRGFQVKESEVVDVAASVW